MSTNKILRELRKTVTEAGGQVVEIAHGKHLKLKVDFGAGVRLLVCSVSPSDGNGLASMKRDIERLKKEAR